MQEAPSIYSLDPIVNSYKTWWHCHLTLQSHPLRTWLQRTDHSQMNLPNSGSDSAKKTKTFLPVMTPWRPMHIPLESLPKHQLDLQSSWPLLGVQGKAALETFGIASLKPQRRERALVWGCAKAWLAGWLLWPLADTHKRLAWYQQSVRYIFGGFVKVRSKLLEGQRTCQDCRGLRVGE